MSSRLQGTSQHTFKGRNERRSIKSRIIKLDRFASPNVTLKLISHILSERQDINFGHYEEELRKFFNEKLDEAKKKEIDFEADNFMENLYQESLNHLHATLMNPYGTIKIAIAGGFSSGKSSLLNYLLQLNNILPTGIEPVSVINTHIVCVSEIEDFKVFGLNFMGQEMALNTEVLNSIQHSNSSKVYISKVLKGLTLYNKVTEDSPFEGVTFIDTPGYNNSASVTANSGSDREKSIEGIMNAHALIWCVDIAQGVLSKTDLDMIKNCTFNKPIIVVFTQTDKRDSETICNVVDKAKNTLRQNGINASVTAVSVHTKEEKTDEKFELLNGKAIKELVSLIKSADTQAKNDEIENEIKVAKERAATYEKTRKNLVYYGEKKELKKRNAQREREKLLEGFLDKHSILASTIRDKLEICDDLLWDTTTIEKETLQATNLRKKEELKIQFLLTLKSQLKEKLQELDMSLKNRKKALLKNSSELKIMDSEDVFSAIRSNDPERFDMALSQGFNEGQCDIQGYTPLTRAIKSHNIVVVKRLIELGADIYGEDQRGYTPFETAVQCHNQVICEILYNKDKSIIESCTLPLHKLAENNDFDRYINNLN